jgi:2-polyprenyl-6-methoxyphenol hydroxylase-like FAD-dependent oxidoreductase
MTAPQSSFDVIVVGARCAGSPCAKLLAERGLRVLLLDRARFPSDQPMSTHAIHARGLGYLEDWGLLPAVEKLGAQAVTHLHLDAGPFAVTSPLPTVGRHSSSLAPRRFLLDHLLVQAAAAAGAEVREGCTVEHLELRDSVVTGVVGRSEAGTTFRETARIVVGADGPGSRVARDAGAEKYYRVPARQGTAWSYWSDVDLQRQIWIAPRDGETVYAFGTSGGLSLIGVNWEIGGFKRMSATLGKAAEDVIRRHTPELFEKMRAGRREEVWRRGATESFFRTPSGPGWALVGDAGHKLDPCTAQGITHAFRDVALLVDALDRGLAGRESLDAALTTYHRERDAWSKPFFDFTCEMARMKPLNAIQLAMLDYGRDHPEVVTRFGGLITTAVAPSEFFALRHMLPLLARIGTHRLKRAYPARFMRRSSAA